MSKYMKVLQTAFKRFQIPFDDSLRERIAILKRTTWGDHKKKKDRELTICIFANLFTRGEFSETCGHLKLVERKKHSLGPEELSAFSLNFCQGSGGPGGRPAGPYAGPQH
jgi:hypothetical protein